ncbi:MAG: hypothetical protein LJD31_01770 [Wolbachia endosymbiont of Menacanthus eurysternus]|nr:hypothetical protein [Wolbachia endosymbiont of Menacanthus eurysternus]
MKKDSKLLASVKDLMSVAGLGAAIGALTCLGLSSTALSPLTIGGIIGFTFPAFLCIGAIPLVPCELLFIITLLFAKIGYISLLLLNMRMKQFA